MSKKRNTSNEIECPLCGGKIWKAQRVIIEGAKLTVCQSCAQHGTKIIQKEKLSYKKSPPSQRAKTGSTKNVFQSRKNIEPSIEIVPDYAKKIRNARMKSKLNQEQFAQKLNEKPSLIRRIESGKVEPTIKLAKKIEKVYNTSLLKTTDDVQVNTVKYMKRKGGSTLGDIAFIKKKNNN